MAFAASRHTWKQIHNSWVHRVAIQRCLCAVGQARVPVMPCRHIATAALSLRIYSSEDCPLCDGLKDKLEALRERAQFQPDIWTNMQVEAIDVYSDQQLKDKYRMRIPVLEVEAAGGEWKELPFQPPRLTADALGKRLEKHIADIRQ